MTSPKHKIPRGGSSSSSSAETSSRPHGPAVFQSPAETRHVERDEKGLQQQYSIYRQRE